jgi:hypothetical protein
MDPVHRQRVCAYFISNLDRQRDFAGLFKTHAAPVPFSPSSTAAEEQLQQHLQDHPVVKHRTCQKYMQENRKAVPLPPFQRHSDFPEVHQKQRFTVTDETILNKRHNEEKAACFAIEELGTEVYSGPTGSCAQPQQFSPMRDPLVCISGFHHTFRAPLTSFVL